MSSDTRLTIALALVVVTAFSLWVAVALGEMGVLGLAMIGLLMIAVGVLLIQGGK